MDALDKRFTIVAGLDSSDMANTVLEYACDLARRHDDAELHILAVAGGKSRAASAELDTAATRLRALVEETLPAFGWAPGAGGWRVRIHVRAGKPSEEILELAADARADVVVIGRHGDRGRMLEHIGNTPEQVLRGARCPVFVVQANDYGVGAQEDVATCPACAAVRRESEGERWFCEQHAAHSDSVRSEYLRPDPYYLDRGGSVWF